MPDKCYYRIKTEEEFRRQFGEEWRTNNKLYFLEEMDVLLGVKIPHDKLKIFIKTMFGHPTEIEIFNKNITGHDFIIGGISWLARVRVRG